MNKMEEVLEGTRIGQPRYAMYEPAVGFDHPQIRAPASTSVARSWKPIHFALNPKGDQIVSWREAVVPGDAVSTLKIKSRCETLEASEMMSTLKKVVMPLTKNLVDARAIDLWCWRKFNVVGTRSDQTQAAASGVSDARTTYGHWRCHSSDAGRA